MKIEVGKEYMLKRRGDDVAVKVVEYKPFAYVTYHPARNSVVRGSCEPDYFLENATPLAAV